MRHRVAEAVVRAWRGPREPVDGSWERVAPWHDGVYAVVALTGRALVSAPAQVSDADLAAWGVDGWGHAHDPRVMTRLAGENGWVDVLDAVLIAEGTGGGLPEDMVPRPDLAGHPRVRHAQPIRRGVRIFGYADDDDSVLTLGEGVGGLQELSFQVAPAQRGRGVGCGLALAARDLVSAGEPLLAAVSPANVPSVRALTRAGFEPVGSVQLYLPE